MKRKILCAAGAAIMLFSTSVAQQWHPVNPELANVVDIFSLSAPSQDVAWGTQRSISGGNSQSYVKTVDGGKTWRSVTIVKPQGKNIINYDWASLHALDSSTAWASFFNGGSKNGGLICKTSDGGKTWINQSTATMFANAKSFLDFTYFWDANEGVAVGDPITPTGTTNTYYEIYTTTNGGATWTAISKDSIPVPLVNEATTINLFSVKGNTIWFGSNKGRMFKSADRGHHWTASAAFCQLVYNVDFVDATHGLANQNDSLFSSSDGGATWTRINPTTSFFSGDIRAIPNSKLFVSSGGHKIDKTHTKWSSSISRDYGKTWAVLPYPTNAYKDSLSVSTMAFVDSTHGFAGGFKKVAGAPIDTTTNYVDFTMMYTWTATPTVLSVNRLAAKELSLYPNPANSVVYLKLDNKMSEVTISVYNALGSLVKNISANGRNGLAEVNISDLDKGVYFIQAQDKDNVYRNKFIKE